MVHSRARSFDAAAAAYEAGRPDWPPEAVDVAARGVAVLYNRLEWSDQATPWRAEADAVFGRHRLPPDDVDPHDETRWRAALAALGEPHDDVVENVQALDLEGLLALYASFSGMAGLPPDGRSAALAEIRAVLERRGVRSAELTYRTEITTASRGGVP